jgi:predicted amidohydrolase
VLGPPDTLGPGSRETKVDPSPHGVVAVDLDFGRISLAICFDINFAELFHQVGRYPTAAPVRRDPKTNRTYGISLSGLEF